jgi:hypothetical protein
MNLRGLLVTTGIVLAMGLTACAGSSQMDRGSTVSAGDPVIGLLDKGITQLNVNINVVSKRIKDLEQASATAGSTPLRELQALDLSGWQLHRQQWLLQRDHLALTRDTLQRVQRNEGDKASLLNLWQEHRRRYVEALDQLRAKRGQLERQHLDVEARLIEEHLR